MRETATGSSSSERVRVGLAVIVEASDFDATGCALHVKGKVVNDVHDIKHGAYHTLDIELNHPVTVTKLEWDSVSIDLVRSACEVEAKADVAAITMDEGNAPCLALIRTGIAFICLITKSMTLVLQRIELQIPKKRNAAPAVRAKVAPSRPLPHGGRCCTTFSP
jgi:protein pelota